MWRATVSAKPALSFPNSGLSTRLIHPKDPRLALQTAPSPAPVGFEAGPPTIPRERLFNGMCFFLAIEPDQREERDGLRTTIKELGGRTYGKPHPHFVTHIILLNMYDREPGTAIGISESNPDKLSFKQPLDDLDPDEWTEAHLGRYFAQTRFPRDHEDVLEWDEECEDAFGPPKGPVISGKKVLRDDWILACARKGKIVDGNECEEYAEVEVFYSGANWRRSAARDLVKFGGKAQLERALPVRKPPSDTNLPFKIVSPIPKPEPSLPVGTSSTLSSYKAATFTFDLSGTRAKAAGLTFNLPTFATASSSTLPGSTAGSLGSVLSGTGTRAALPTPPPSASSGSEEPRVVTTRNSLPVDTELIPIGTGLPSSHKRYRAPTNGHHSDRSTSSCTPVIIDLVDDEEEPYDTDSLASPPAKRSRTSSATSQQRSFSLPKTLLPTPPRHIFPLLSNPRKEAYDRMLLTLEASDRARVMLLVQRLDEVGGPGKARKGFWQNLDKERPGKTRFQTYYRRHQAVIDGRLWL